MSSTNKRPTSPIGTLNPSLDDEISPSPRATNSICCSRAAGEKVTLSVLHVPGDEVVALETELVEL